MQFLDMPVPDTDPVLERGGVGTRFRVFEAAEAGAESNTVLLLGFLRDVRMPARRGHTAAQTIHIQTNQGA